MGWNESRVTVVPKGRDLIVQELSGQAMSGEPMRLISVEKSPDFGSATIEARDIDDWLLKQRFTHAEQWKAGRSYRHNDMLVEVYSDGAEVGHILLEFTLTRESPNRWNDWLSFVELLCESWPVFLADPDARMMVGPEELFTLLRRTTAWRDFEANYCWPPPPNCAGQSHFSVDN
jgi:hypothetical protein